MHIIVDERQTITAGYVAGFDQEGLPALGLPYREFHLWFEASASSALDKVQGFLLGECEGRTAMAATIRRRSQAPVIALCEARSLGQTLDLFSAEFDDVVRQPIHVREILARSESIWRRIHDSRATETRQERLKVFFDGRDPEIDGIRLPLPRRERDILEHLVRHRGRWVPKGQIYRTIYDASDELEETVVEGHISKLRKKLRKGLGYDPIQAQRHAGYSFLS
ncbi:winged helix-turn-helix domain-containing protein [Microvirga sp. M2]|uniref:winged helix-turn-helix domain-containing protein n=1 Tax=Microvirga sp. M2 TaxID=3073270 RepID=UPI0039C4AFFB